VADNSTWSWGHKWAGLSGKESRGDTADLWQGVNASAATIDSVRSARAFSGALEFFRHESGFIGLRQQARAEVTYSLRE
jgi:hypothetical protein